MDWLWIIIGAGTLGAASVLLTGAAGTKSASERMLKTYAELLAAAREPRHARHAAAELDEPTMTDPADGPADDN